MIDWLKNVATEGPAFTRETKFRRSLLNMNPFLPVQAARKSVSE